MPEQTFQLTLSNVRGTGANLSAYDPMTDKYVPVHVLGAGPASITVSLPTVDYPRLLVIQESQPGPLVVAPKLSLAADGSAELVFSANLKCRAAVSWGTVPDRASGGAADLPAATDFTYRIPRLEPGCGAKIVLAADGLTARWPRWGHDTAGMHLAPQP
jgi:hypothetical protein